jgi:hypothetical protein
VLFVLLRSAGESSEYQSVHLMTAGGLPRGLPKPRGRHGCGLLYFACCDGQDCVAEDRQTRLSRSGAIRWAEEPARRPPSLSCSLGLGHGQPDLH